MSKRHCLDNPTKPHKAFRDVLVKRNKVEEKKLEAQLVPAIAAAFEDFRRAGKQLSTELAAAYKKELGAALVAALDGTYESDPHCPSCDFKEKEKERMRACEENDEVRPPTLALPAALTRRS